MRFVKNIVVGLAMALLLSTGASFAGSDLNEVGAFLVYPAIFSIPHYDRTGFETFVTITNASASNATAHVSFINGDEWSDFYCYECDFDFPLTGNDTEVLVVTFNHYGGTVIESEDRTVSHSCDADRGFMTVDLEDGAGNVLTDNVLLGSEVVVNYNYGFAYSVPAIPFQGRNGGDGDRTFEFDDVEYGRMPRIIAADFIAPDIDGDITAALALFTLNFERQYPPDTDCSVTGYDAAENPFSRSFRFGCWTWADLCDISPEFCYPNLSGTPCNPGPVYDDEAPGDLSQIECDTHGWLKLDCRVRQDPNQPGAIPTALGGVHGALIQVAKDGSKIRRNDHYAPRFHGAAAWARLLYQSVTPGSSVTLHLESPGGGLN